MDYKEVLLNRVKEINSSARNLKLSYQRLEVDLNDLVELTENLIEELEELKLKDTKAVARRHGQHRESQVTLEQCRKLINRRVRIINPNGGEPNQGYITGIGTFFVHIKKTNGDRTKRAAKNIRLIHNE